MQYHRVFKKFNILLIALFLIFGSNFFKSENAFASLCRICQKEAPLSCSSCKALSLSTPSHYCSKPCQKIDWHARHKEEHAFMTSLEGATTIRPSNLPDSGLGLFAVRAFKPNDTIAIYDGELVENNFSYQIQHHSHAYSHNLSTQTHHILGRIGITSDQSHLGGQMANDPLIDSKTLARLLAIDCSNLKQDYLDFIQEFSDRYTRATLEELKNPNLINASFNTQPQSIPHLWNGVIKALRPIQTEEEIFVTYGLNYWLNIPMALCDAHGYPENTLKIQRAASIGVEEIAAAAKHDPKRIFQSYVNEAGAHANQKIIEANLLPMKLSSLFGSIHFFQIEITHPEAFQKMADDLKINEQLDLIAHLPNDEFYKTQTHWCRIHPKSRQLLKSMIDYQRTHATPTFSQSMLSQLQSGQEEEITPEILFKLQTIFLKPDNWIFNLVNVLTRKILSDTERSILINE